MELNEVRWLEPHTFLMELVLIVDHSRGLIDVGWSAVKTLQVRISIKGHLSTAMRATEQLVLFATVLWTWSDPQEVAG